MYTNTCSIHPNKSNFEVWNCNFTLTLSSPSYAPTPTLSSSSLPLPRTKPWTLKKKKNNSITIKNNKKIKWKEQYGEEKRQGIWWLSRSHRHILRPWSLCSADHEPRVTIMHDSAIRHRSLRHRRRERGLATQHCSNSVRYFDFAVIY